MPKLSHAELVVLGFLGADPSHAYEIIERIRAARVDQWARVPESTVYSVLRRMERAGWVAGEEVEGGRGGGRTVYERTPEGYSRLVALLDQALLESEPMYSDILVGAVFAHDARLTGLLERGLDRARDLCARASAQSRDLESPYSRAIIEFYSGMAELHVRLLQRFADPGGASGDDTETSQD